MRRYSFSTGPASAHDTSVTRYMVDTRRRLTVTRPAALAFSTQGTGPYGATSHCRSPSCTRVTGVVCSSPVFRPFVVRMKVCGMRPQRVSGLTTRLAIRCALLGWNRFAGQISRPVVGAGSDFSPGRSRPFPLSPAVVPVIGPTLSTRSARSPPSGRITLDAQIVHTHRMPNALQRRVGDGTRLQYPVEQDAVQIGRVSEQFEPSAADTA